MTKQYRFKRLISGILIAGLLIYLSYKQFNKPSTQEMMGAPTVLVSVAPVTIEDTPIIVNVFGNLRAMDAAEITSEIDGTITEIFFNSGQMVEVGAPLIRIDDASEQAMVAQAKAELELNTVEYNRMENLLAKKAAPIQEKDKAKATLDISQAQLQIATAELEKTLLKAPFAGMLGAKNLSVGHYVTSGDPLLSIVDRNFLILEYSVSEQYLSQVQLGQKVELATSAYPNETFFGAVNFIAPQIDEMTRTLDIEALIDNKDGRLSPGLSVKLTHILGHKTNGIKIPEESLVPTVEGYKVFVIQEDIANSVPIEVESRVRGFAYVAQGLKAGDQVVTRGQEKLREGAKVEILNPNANSEQAKED